MIVGGPALLPQPIHPCEPIEGGYPTRTLAKFATMDLNF